MAASFRSMAPPHQHPILCYDKTVQLQIKGARDHSAGQLALVPGCASTNTLFVIWKPIQFCQKVLEFHWADRIGCCHVQCGRTQSEKKQSLPSALNAFRMHSPGMWRSGSDL